MTTIAIIPARGGSKGIPSKNLMEVNGKPLIAWTIEQAFQTNSIDDVFVSSEDREVLGIASDCGAFVIRRPDELATDKATTDSVLVHAAKELRKETTDFDYVVTLQPTSPLRMWWTIDRAVEKCRRTGSDSCLTLRRGPIFTWSRHGEDSSVAGDELRPVNVTLSGRVRRQDLQGRNIVWTETGSVYVTRAQVLLKYGQRLYGAITCIEVPAEESIEIDTPYDAWLVEQRMKYLESEATAEQPTDFTNPPKIRPWNG